MKVEDFLIKTGAVLLSGWAIYITVNLVNESLAGQGETVLLMSYLAIAVSVIGLLFLRYSQSRRVWGTAIIGGILWLFGAGFLMQTELTFWKSNYEQRHAQYTTVKSAALREEGRINRAWDSLMTGRAPETVAQIEARIKAQKFDPAYDRTAQCTDATRADSRKFCADLALLEADLAAAKRREQNEKILTQEAEQTKKNSHFLNVFAGAEAIAAWFSDDPTSEDIKKWSERIVLMSVIFLFLVRDMPLFIAFAPDRSRRHEPRRESIEEAAKRLAGRLEVVTPPSAPAKQIPAPEAPQDDFQAKEDEKQEIEKPELPPEAAKAPKGPRLGALASLGKSGASDEYKEIDNPATLNAPEPVDNVVPIRADISLGKPSRTEKIPKRAKAKARIEPKSLIEQKRDAVDLFVSERLIEAEMIRHPRTGNHKSGGTPGGQVYKAFRAWAKGRDVPEIGNKQFGKIISVERAKAHRGVVYGVEIVAEKKAKSVA